MGQSSFWQQLKALLHRNLLIKWRSKGQTAQEILTPLYFVVILIVVGTFSVTDEEEKIPSFPQVDIYSSFHFFPGYTSFYGATPNSSHVADFMSATMEELGNAFNMTQPPEYMLFENEELMESFYEINGSSMSLAVVFGDNDPLKDLSYTIRLPEKYMSLAINLNSMYGYQGNCRRVSPPYPIPLCLENYYIFSGFAVFQSVIDTTFLKLKTGRQNLTQKLYIRQMPKSSLVPNLVLLQTLSSIYLVAAFSPFVSFLLVLLVYEKEKKIKETMRMMGMRDSVFWISWGLIYTAMVTIICLIVEILAKFLGLFPGSNFLLMFLLFLFYCLSIITFGFMLTPFFSKSNTAGAVGSFATVLFSMLYFLVKYVPNLSSGVIWLLRILSPVALALAVDDTVLYETTAGGISWDNFTEGYFGSSMLMLIIDTFLYLLLAAYLDNVVPGEFGSRYPLYYCFMPSYWCPPDPSNKEHYGLLQEDRSIHCMSNGNNAKDMEPISQEFIGKEAVKIYNITKVFKGADDEDIKAVDDFSIIFYESQITALLGHNGAGKTTLINILTGMIPPTRGKATINGLNVSEPTELNVIRTMTGVCPQHDILFDQLTCKEHLIVTAKLKGVIADRIEPDVNAMLEELDLDEKATTIAKKLSGGQKRKLSLAIALIGDPKIVFLDEPTSGLDPYSRRTVWSLLRERKKGKMILLTTHFMDEADILADRKAIMSLGRLRCVGSSLFLKNRFGIGYHLYLVINSECVPDYVTAVVMVHVPTAQVARIHGMELSYILPLKNASSFSKMFAELDEKKTELGVCSYGISMTTLEEVFLKLGEGADEIMGTEVEVAQHLVKRQASMMGVTDEKRSCSTQRQVSCQVAQTANNAEILQVTAGPLSCGTLVSEVEQHSLQVSRWQQFKTLLRVRWLNILRSPKAVVFRVVLPVILVIISMVFLATYKPPETKQPVLVFSHNMYPGPLLYINSTTGESLDDLVNIISSLNITPSLLSSYDDILSLPGAHYLAMDIRSFMRDGEAVDWVAIYNDTGIHTVPVLFNLFATSRLYALTGNESSVITTKINTWKSKESEFTWDTNTFIAVMFLGTALSVVPAGFSAEIVRDRQIKCSSQLRVSGIEFAVYWGTFFVSHIIQCLIPFVLCLAVVLIFDLELFSSAGAVLSMILLIILCLPVITFSSYALSFVFNNYQTAEGIVASLNYMAAYIPYMAVVMPDMFGAENVASALHIVFCVIDPYYLLLGGLYYISKVHAVGLISNQSSTVSSYFSWSSNIPVTMLVAVIDLFALALLVRILAVFKTGGDIRDALFLGGKLAGKNRSFPLSNADKIDDEDSDVKEERDKVEQYNTPSDPDSNESQVPVVMVRNLRKEYNGGGCCNTKKNIKVAVRNLSLAIDRGEVFGLLGPNGAGKTSTLNVITAEESPTTGNVMVTGYDVTSCLSDAFQAMGYCPQHNALWPDITVREHLESYASIRGMSPANVKSVASYFLDALSISEHADKRAKQISGGTKRKLSFAMSMLGEPKIVLLDEPSSGMDPQAKRFLWDTISASFVGQRGAILTTHSMEEADALCSRVGIMVGGALRCLGSTQHLKNKFGGGYLLEIRGNWSGTTSDSQEKMDELHAYIVELFPMATRREHFAERATYHVPQSDVKSLSNVFANLEQGKERGIAQYSFSQSTLEQVFLQFAKIQEEEDFDDNFSVIKDDQPKHVFRSLSLNV